MANNFEDTIEQVENEDNEAAERLLDLAIIEALTNIKNCARIGSFTANSIKNFKNAYLHEAEIIKAAYGEIATVDEWMNMVYKHAIKSQTVMEAADKCFHKAAGKLKLTKEIRESFKLEPFEENMSDDDEEDTKGTKSDSPKIKKNENNFFNNSDNLLINAFLNISKSLLAN